MQVESPHDVATTIDKLEAVLESKGMNVFGRVDHAANAEKVGLSLRPTQLLLFGNPNLGTPLMVSAQSAAMDLPQKMLAFQDESGNVFLSWDDPQYLKDCLKFFWIRHRLFSSFFRKSLHHYSIHLIYFPSYFV